MISEYKNIERLRYRLSNDISDASKSSDSIFKRIFRVVFSAAFSFYLSNASRTFFGIGTTNEKSNGQWILALLILTLIFVVIFVVTYGIFSFLSFIYRNIKRVGRKSNEKIRDSEKKKATKDFDNISIDSVMLVQEYIESYNKLSNETSIDNDDQKQFYLFEALHYIDTACQYAKPIITLDCIVKAGYETSKYVDDYRFNNFLEILSKQIDFLVLDNKYDYITSDELLNYRFEVVVKEFRALGGVLSQETESVVMNK